MCDDRRSFSNTSDILLFKDNKTSINVEKRKLLEERLISLADNVVTYCLRNYSTEIQLLNLADDLHKLHGEAPEEIDFPPIPKKTLKIMRSTNKTYQLDQKNDELFLVHLKDRIKTELELIKRREKIATDSFDQFYNELLATKLEEFRIARSELAKSYQKKKTKSLRDTIKENPVIQISENHPETIPIIKQIEIKFKDLLIGSKITYNPRQEGKSLVITFSGPHNEIQSLVKLIPTALRKNPPQYKKGNLAEYQIIGKESVILSLLENNTFTRSVKEKINEIPIEKTKSNDQNIATGPKPSTKLTPVSLNESERVAWEKMIHSGFCFASEVTINWNESQTCFVIDLPTVRKWHLLAYKGKVDQHELITLNDELLQTQIISRVNDYFKDGLAKIEVCTNQLKIYPYVAKIPFTGELHDSVYTGVTKSIQKKNKPVSVPTSNAPVPLNQDKDTEEDAKEKKKPDNSDSANPPSTEDKVKSLFDKLIKDACGACTGLIIDKASKKSKKYRISIVQGAESMHLKDANPMDSGLFLKMIVKYFRKCVGFIQFYSDPPRLIIDPNMIDQAIQLAKTKKTFSVFLSKEIENLRIVPLGEEHLYMKDMKEENENKKNVTSTKTSIDIYYLMKKSIAELDQPKTVNLNYHLKELEKIPSPNNSLTNNDQINYYNYSLHVFGIMRLLSYGTGQPKNFFNSWRNIIHHASTQLEWKAFYDFIHPIIVLIGVFSHNSNNQLFVNPPKKTSNTIQKVINELDKFADQLASRTLGRGSQKSVTAYKEYLSQLINSAEVNENIGYQKAIMRLCSLIGKATREEPYLSIHKAIGHLNLDINFEIELLSLYQRHRHELMNLHKNNATDFNKRQVPA